jgi:hypothetical protein
MTRYVHRRNSPVIAFALVLFFANGGVAQTIQYSVSMQQPSSHLFRIEMIVDRPGVSTLELSLPSWNALYQIRDFAQYVHDFRANVPFKRASASPSATAFSPMIPVRSAVSLTSSTDSSMAPACFYSGRKSGIFPSNSRFRSRKRGR